MKKLRNSIFTLGLLFYALVVNAQEREYELTSNPLLFSKHTSSAQQKISAINKRKIIFLKDTISRSLPFVDDFSSNKFTSYDTAKYSKLAKSDSVRYSFKINGAIPLVDTIYYIKDTAYSYSYNAVTNKLDSIKLPPVFNLSLYGNSNKPTMATANFDVWNPYTRPIYDTVADTLQANLLVKQFTIKILEIDSITFVDTRIYPKTTLWYENEVFVNSSFPINPPSIGVATFDGLDSTGYPYNFSNPTSYGLADKLTSKYLNLGISLGINDSIVLSFFCQPKGLGNFPESTDSLVLDFKQTNGTWSHVWSLPGKNLIYPDTAFKKVSIALKQGSPYLYNGFQFRFKNYATLSGNVDHWHLDYVNLKKVSIAQDTVVRDIAFVNPPQSLLKEFQAIPFSQYTPSMMKSNVKNTIVNLNRVTENFQSYTYFINDNDANLLFTYPNAGSQNIPSYLNGYYNFGPHTFPPVNFSFPDTDRCRDFTITHTLAIAGVPGTDQINTNDTVKYIQHFNDYYAYDDASAESSYGVVQAGGQAALKFTLSVSDTMNAVYIYFNPAVDNATNKVFKLRIWSDAGGVPGALLYQSTQNYSPSYARIINGFLKFDLDDPIPLSGTFYVGWVQSTANELNVGLDKNNNNSNKLFFNLGLGDGWQQSIISGSLMLHPVFKSCPYLYIGIPEKSKSDLTELDVYPNPANDRLFFKTAKPFDAFIYVHDLTGKIVLSKFQSTTEGIDISTVPGGIYFIRVENKSLHTFVNKKIVVIK